MNYDVTWEAGKRSTIFQQHVTKELFILYNMNLGLY